MPNEKAISKVIYGGQTLIDLTSDTVEASKLLKGYKAHGKDGQTVVGTCDFDSNTQDATATASELLTGKSAYVRGSKINGAMPNNGASNLFIETLGTKVQIPQGYHDGSGYADINADDKAKLIPANIKQGIEILGVTGTMTGKDEVKVQAKEATPSKTQQIITPDVGNDYLSQVTVKPIPYQISDNSAGGQTVTIG